MPRTSSPGCRERDRFGALLLSPKCPSSSSSMRVCPTFGPDLRPESNLCNPPAGADEVRLPIPGRCGGTAGIACARSLEARSRRACEDITGREITGTEGEVLRGSRNRIRLLHRCELQLQQVHDGLELIEIEFGRRGCWFNSS